MARALFRSSFLLSFTSPMLSPSMLLLLFLPAISADCFIEQQSPGKRTILNVSSTVDEFHCKIRCFQNPSCIAYTYNGAVKGCAQLGPVSGLTCTAPTSERLRTTKGCPILSANSALGAEYVQNPEIDFRNMLPIRIVGSYYAVNIEWDAALGAWFYKDHKAPPIYIRSAGCFSIPLADARALDAASCVPLTVFKGKEGYGPPSAPYNRSWPCDDGRAKQIHYLSAGGNNNTMAKDDGVINCVYGEWLWLQFYTTEKIKQTRGIITASCA